MENENSLYAVRIAQINALPFQLAEIWDESCVKNIFTYYKKLFPWWPENRRRFPPNNKFIIAQLSNSIAPELLIESRIVLQARIATLFGAKIRIERTTVDLLQIALIAALAVDNNIISPESDPGAPLMELFRNGYQVAYTDAGIEIHYQEGWNILKVPSREDLF